MKCITILSPFPTARLFFLVLLSCTVYIPLQAQDCFIQMERLSDSSIRMTTSGSTTNSTKDGAGFSMSTSAFWDVNPSNFTGTITENTLTFNDEAFSAFFGSTGGFGFMVESKVTGTLCATGSVVVTWPDGQLKPIGTSGDLFHTDALFPVNICQIGLVAETPGGITSPCGEEQNIPTLSQWGLIILALLFMTFGTLYLIQEDETLLKKLKKQNN